MNAMSAPSANDDRDVGAVANAGVDHDRHVGPDAGAQRGEHVDGRRAPIELTTAVVGEVETGDADVERPARIGGPDRTFQQQRTAPPLADAFDIGPVQRLIEQRADACRRGTLDLCRRQRREVGKADRRTAQHPDPVARPSADVDDRARAELWRDGQAVAQVAGAAAGDDGVDGDLQRLISGRGSAVDQRVAEPAITGDVQLEPQVGMAGGGDVFDGRRAHRRQRVRECPSAFAARHDDTSPVGCIMRV